MRLAEREEEKERNGTLCVQCSCWDGKRIREKDSDEKCRKMAILLQEMAMNETEKKRKKREEW